MSKPADIINPHEIPIRDYLMVDIIKGITKSGIHVDRKKENNKKECRKKIRREDE